MVKLITRAETFKTQWGLAGDLVKIVGFQATTAPDPLPLEFQIQWDCGRVQNLKHLPHDLIGMVWKHTLFDASFYHHGSLANLQKVPC